MFKYIQNFLIMSVILIIIATMILLHIAIDTSVIYLIYSYILYYIIFTSNLPWREMAKRLGVIFHWHHHGVEG